MILKMICSRTQT